MWFGRATRRLGRDVIAGARPRTHQAARFEQVIGFEHGRRAHMSAGDELAHGGQAIAGAQGAGGDGGGDVVGQSFVERAGTSL